MSIDLDARDYMRWREEKYAKSEFRQRINAIHSDPVIVEDAASLVSFWQFAVAQRETDKDIQDLIAWDSGLKLISRLSDAGLKFEHVDELYEIALMFSSLDHKDNWQSPALTKVETQLLNAEVDRDWSLLQQRIDHLERSLLR